MEPSANESSGFKPADARSDLGVRQPQGFPALPAGWKTEWETFQASDGKTRLFAFFHRKKEPATLRRILVVCHGFGEHSGRYLHFPHYLEESIDALYAYDQRGHGRSDGARGDGDRFDGLAEDLALVIRRLHEKFPQAELHLLGHSMGGHVALRTGFLHPGLPLKTFQISSPYLGLFTEPAAALRVVASVLARTWGTLSLSADVDPVVVSRDPAVIENYGTDRLNHSRMTPRFFRSMVITQKDTLQRTKDFPYPLAVHISLADRLVSAAAARKFYEALECPGKRLFEYPDFRHEPMNEIGKEKFFDQLGAVITNSV
jgi:alpha-beta hydrolase superfamily lysophospholipase